MINKKYCILSQYFLQNYDNKDKKFIVLWQLNIYFYAFNLFVDAVYFARIFS